ncbi:hypothetical protein K443DRAFT_114232, partial [Laccaria amethystina LaAM-08-1]
ISELQPLSKVYLQIHFRSHSSSEQRTQPLHPSIPTNLVLATFSPCCEISQSPTSTPPLVL